jgi:hypothetical protein
LSSALHIRDLSHVLVRPASAGRGYLTTVGEVIVGTPTGGALGFSRWSGRRTSVRRSTDSARKGGSVTHHSFEIARALLGSVGMSQANERMWRMPGHLEAMKGAVSCDKRGGAAHTHRSRDARMGKPGWEESQSPRKWSERGELKHLSTCRKRNQTRCPE